MQSRCALDAGQPCFGPLQFRIRVSSWRRNMPDLRGKNFTSGSQCLRTSLYQNFVEQIDTEICYPHIGLFSTSISVFLPCYLFLAYCACHFVKAGCLFLVLKNTSLSRMFWVVNLPDSLRKISSHFRNFFFLVVFFYDGKISMTRRMLFEWYSRFSGIYCIKPQIIRIFLSVRIEFIVFKYLLRHIVVSIVWIFLFFFQGGWYMRIYLLLVEYGMHRKY